LFFQIFLGQNILDVVCDVQML